MARSIIATIRGGLTTIFISYLFFPCFFFTFGRKSLSLLLVICGFGDLEIGILIWVFMGLCMYFYEICIYEFWFGYLWVVCIFVSFICMFVSFICICLLHLCFHIKIDWSSTFWCSWIVFVDVCTWEISMFISWVLRFDLACFFWCMGEREMKEEDDTFWEKWKRSEDCGLWLLLFWINNNVGPHKFSLEVEF